MHGSKVGVAFALVISVGVGITYVMDEDYDEDMPSKKRPQKKKVDKSGMIPSYTNPTTNPPPQINQQKPAVIAKPMVNGVVGGDKSKRYRDLIGLITKSLNANPPNPHIDMRVLISIHEALMELCKSDYVSNITENRAKRRPFLESNPEQYEVIVNEGMRKIDLIMKEKIDLLIGDLNISLGDYEQSCDYWASTNQQFAMMSVMMMEKMKLDIPSKVELTIETLVEIMQFQVDQYPKLTGNRNGIIPAGAIKKVKLDDMTSEHYGVEEEDVAKFIQKQGPTVLYSNPILMQSMQQLQMMIQRDMQGMM